MIQATQDRPAPAAPEADADSAFFWKGLREHTVLLQECTRCKRTRFPAMPCCPYCAARESLVRAASGLGTVYSWIVVHRAFDPAFAGDVPYTLASIDLDEGGRLVGRLEGRPATFGMRVRAAFHDHPDWTELRFQPLEGSR